jgi:hypothetical protein
MLRPDTLFIANILNYLRIVPLYHFISHMKALFAHLAISLTKMALGWGQVYVI